MRPRMSRRGAQRSWSSESPEVRLTSDVRGLTIDFDGFAAQAVNDDHAQPLRSALARGIDRCKMKQKSDELTRAREAAQGSPEID